MDRKIERDDIEWILIIGIRLKDFQITLEDSLWSSSYFYRLSFGSYFWLIAETKEILE